MKTVVFYVSGHGLGHSARALGVAAAIPQSHRLIICTSSPRWFWEGECGRPFEWRPLSFDTGAVQIDNLRSDGMASLKAAALVNTKNEKRLASEVAYLRDVGASAVVTDVPPFPLKAASQAGVPSALICNFTWVDIYKPYLSLVASDEARHSYASMIDVMAEQYDEADVVLRTPLSMDMAHLSSPTVDIPLIVRPYHNVRDKLRAYLGVPEGHRVVLVSTGIYGVDYRWAALEKVADTTFVGFSVPDAAKGVVQQLPYPDWRSQDVTAAVDAVVSKAGYGTIAECMAGGTPLIYPPRPTFAEHGALVRGMEVWGGGVAISGGAFLGLDISAALKRAYGATPLREVDVGGAGKAVAVILEMAEQGGDYSFPSQRKG